MPEQNDKRRFMDWFALTLGGLALACLLPAGMSLALGHPHTAKIWGVIAVVFGVCWGFAWVGSNLGAAADGSAGSGRHSRQKINIAIAIMVAYGMVRGIWVATGSTALAWGALPIVAALTYWAMSLRADSDG